ncbi:MAG: hypothetical protein ACRD6R_06235 [Candidatus Polarisedimenticolia bacterium]
MSTESARLTPLYRVAKREVPAEISLVGQPPAPFRLFLSGQARLHAGDERPSDLLNGGESFIPAVDRQGVVHFLCRDTLLIVSVAADHEFGSETAPETAAPPTVRQQVQVLLEDGVTVKGVVESRMPEPKNRLLDCLNLADRFLAVRAGPTVHLVNKTRIVRVDAS